MSTVMVYDSASPDSAFAFYGDGDDHEMILRYLDGWYGTPESKVQLKERQLGNGSHDVAESDITYGSRTVGVDWRILADSRDQLLSLQEAVRRLAGRTVRVRVVDGSRDMFAMGYVHESSVDKAQQNIPKQTSTGSLTIVCQRPEILSTRASQVQLMPVSRVRGGLSYGVPAYELAWTGTAKASASTLSQDGQVVATNLETDPTCLQARGRNESSINVVHNANGTWTYTTIDGSTRWIIPVWKTRPTVAGMIVFAQWAETNVQQTGVEGTLVASGPGWAAYAVNAKLQMGIYYPVGVSFTLLHTGLYTASDWQAMQALGVDWFDGDSQSPQPNAGLSYGPDGKGLSYGVLAGGERNLAVLSNHGTTNAYPTLTVTGPFPAGVEIQTGSGGVIRYTGAIGMVPLVLQCDPRNVAASMGGVDVGRYLTGRDLPAIPAGGSMSLRLMSAGSGWVTVTTRDTYL